MLWAASLTTLFSSSHSSDVTVENEASYDHNTHLSFSNLAMDNTVSSSVMSLNIKCSKTNQCRVGCLVILGKTVDDHCPIMALLDNLTRRRHKSEALFQWHDGTPLSKTWFVEAVRQALTTAYLPAQDYAGHSFRIGAATTAAMVELEYSTIQTLGWWKSVSYQLYTRMDPHQLGTVSFSLSICNIWDSTCIVTPPVSW